MSDSTASSAVITVGAVTATAATSGRRVVDHVIAKSTVIEVVHDQIHFVFGGTQAVAASSTVMNTTTPTYGSFNVAPMVVGPNQSLVIVRWAASQTTGSTNEFVFGYVEK